MRAADLDRGRRAVRALRAAALDPVSGRFPDYAGREGHLGNGSPERKIGVSYKAAWRVKHRIKLRTVAGFRQKAIQSRCRRDVAPGSRNYSDGLSRFGGVAAAGRPHVSIVTGGGRASVRVKEFVWSDNVTGNVKTALRSTHHSMNGKCAQRYLSEFEYRFNRRHDLPSMVPRLAWAAVRTPPTSEKLFRKGPAGGLKSSDAAPPRRPKAIWRGRPAHFLPKNVDAPGRSGRMRSGAPVRQIRPRKSVGGRHSMVPGGESASGTGKSSLRTAAVRNKFSSASRSAAPLENSLCIFLVLEHARVGSRSECNDQPAAPHAELQFCGLLRLEGRSKYRYEHAPLQLKFGGA